MNPSPRSSNNLENILKYKIAWDSINTWKPPSIPPMLTLWRVHLPSPLEIKIISFTFVCQLLPSGYLVVGGAPPSVSSLGSALLDSAVGITELECLTDWVISDMEMYNFRRERERERGKVLRKHPTFILLTSNQESYQNYQISCAITKKWYMQK